MADRPLEARAFAPSHITGFFQIFKNGSTGAGLNTEAGAVTEARLAPASESSLEVRINDTLSDAPVSRSVVEKFRSKLPVGTLSVRHEIAYPIGYGMGMSGAGAFSLALVLNELSGSPYSYTETMELAVQAEIESGTGLGDVVAQQFQGIMIGLAPYPSRTVEILESEKDWVVCAFFEPLETKKIIRSADWVERINAIGAQCMAELLRERSVEHFIELSRRFTRETGLANPQVLDVLERVPGSSMAMLGQTAFLLTKDPEEGKRLFKNFTDEIIVSHLARTGARII